MLREYCRQHQDDLYLPLGSQVVRIVGRGTWYYGAMENIATSVRVSSGAMGVLSELSEKLGQSKAQVIEKALKELEERLFWQETQAAFGIKAASACWINGRLA